MVIMASGVARTQDGGGGAVAQDGGHTPTNRLIVASSDIEFYYINTSEIPSELSRENFISSRVKIT